MAKVQNWEKRMEPNTEKIDEAVLGLMYLTRVPRLEVFRLGRD